MDPVKKTGARTAIDSAALESGVQELRSGDRAVLSGGDSRDFVPLDAPRSSRGTLLPLSGGFVPPVIGASPRGTLSPLGGDFVPAVVAGSSRGTFSAV
jgi:hypothetical protein